MLVNNAGQGRVSTFANTEDAAWTEELQLKFFSVIHPTRAFLPQLAEQRGARRRHRLRATRCSPRQPEPHMVGDLGARGPACSTWCARWPPNSRRSGVRVNGILIGLVESGQWRRRFEAREEDRHLDWAAWTRGQLARRKHPAGPPGPSAEAARAILFLASPLSSYTTGSHIDISGGLSRHA